MAAKPVTVEQFVSQSQGIFEIESKADGVSKVKCIPCGMIMGVNGNRVSVIRKHCKRPTHKDALKNSFTMNSAGATTSESSPNKTNEMEQRKKKLVKMEKRIRALKLGDKCDALASESNVFQYYCKGCDEKLVVEDDIRVIDAHVLSAKHQEKFVHVDGYTDKEFDEYLVRSFVMVNDDPIESIDKNVIKHFFKDDVTHAIKSGQFYRDLVKTLYQKYIEDIRNRLGDDRLWVSIGESLDENSQFWCAFTVGSIDHPDVGSFTLQVAAIDGQNAAGIVKFIRDGLQFLLPQLDFNDPKNKELISNKVLLLVTNDTSKYVDAVKTLADGGFTKMIHFNCLLNSMHQFVERLFMSHYKNVKILLDTVTKLFKGHLERYLTFRTMEKFTEFPPHTNPRQSGSYITALKFYFNKDNRETLRDFLKYSLGSKDQETVRSKRMVQKLLFNPKVLEDMRFLDSKFRCVLDLFDKLKEKKLTFGERMTRINSFRNNLAKDQKINGSVLQLLDEILAKNPSYASLNDFIKNQHLDGSAGTLNKDEIDCLVRTPTGAINPNQGAANLDVIWYRNEILNLSPESVNHHVVIQCFLPYIEVKPCSNTIKMNKLNGSVINYEEAFISLNSDQFIDLREESDSLDDSDDDSNWYESDDDDEEDDEDDDADSDDSMDLDLFAELVMLHYHLPRYVLYRLNANNESYFDGSDSDDESVDHDA